MIKRALKMCAGVLVCGLMIIGCEKSDESVPAAAKDAANKATGAMNSAVDKTKEMAADLSAEAQKLLDQAKQYIADKKFDLADDTVKKLEAYKAKLPAEWQTKIDDVRKMLDTAKQAVGNAMTPPPATPTGNR